MVRNKAVNKTIKKNFLPFVLRISSSRLRAAAKSCTIASDKSSNRLRSTSSGFSLPASPI